MNFKNLIYKTQRETRKKNVLIKTIVFYINYFLQHQKHHKKAEFLAKKLIKLNSSIGYFYLAELNFIYGRFDESLKNINIFLDKSTFNPDGIYLKVKVLVELNKRDIAWEILENLLEKSSRLKTWLFLSNYVNSEEYFKKYIAIHEKFKDKFKKHQDKLDDYLIVASKRSGNYDLAKNVLQNKILQNSNRDFTKKIKDNKFFTQKDAKIALEDMKKIFDKHNLKFFLVSGTFLGCVRENKILGHDKDIDIGVFDEYSYEYLKQIIQSSGCFILHEPLSDKILKAKHLNGILIDVFIHYKDDDFIYHEGVKTRWFNKYFDLIEYDFLGNKYLGPKNYDMYLSENYGQWQIPKKDFDYVLDTPNMEVINNDEYVLHLYNLLLKPYVINNRKRILKALEDIGEIDFLSQLKITTQKDLDEK